MRPYALTAALCLALSHAAACVEPLPDDPGAASPLSSVEAPVIYGADDRLEVFAASAPARHAARSVAMLVRTSQLAPSGTGHQLALTSTVGASKQLCATEPFRDQPDPGLCSGFMVGPDLVATAGHCVDAASCATTAFVFDWGLSPTGTAKRDLAADEVYTCSAVIGRAYSSGADWAVVRVDRPIVGREPLPVRGAGQVASGAGVAVIGHPFGIPAKVAGGASVQANTMPTHFSANLDTYGGNSGSPVFDATFSVVEGVLVRGQADLVAIGKGKTRCFVSNTCPDTGCPGHEEVTRSTGFAHLLVPAEPCDDDAFEDNDDAATATPFSGDLTFDGLALCAGDADWFRTFVDAGSVLTASVSFVHADGDLTLELRDGLGSLVAVSATSSDLETVTHAPRSFGGTLYVVVRGVGGAQNAYALTTAVEAATGGACGDGVCDAGESCDGRNQTQACASDCPGRTSGNARQRFCWVGGQCEGPGC